MGRKKLSEEEKAARKSEREAKKKGIVKELEEEVEELAEDVEEKAKDEIKALTGKEDEEESQELGFDPFAQQ